MLFRHRSKFDSLSKGIGAVFASIPLSANAWTLLSLIPAVFAAYFLWTHEFLLAAVIALIAAAIDIIDGAVARHTKTASVRGAYIDTIVDRYVEAILVVGLFLANLPSLVIPVSLIIFLYFFGALMTTYAKAAAKEKNLVTNEVRGGILERAERLLLLIIGIGLASISPDLLTAMIALLAVGTNVSALQRIAIALKQQR